jgi:hypothetical protein
MVHSVYHSAAQLPIGHGAHIGHMAKSRGTVFT